MVEITSPAAAGDAVDASAEDPILPKLRAIRNAFDDFCKDPEGATATHFKKLLEDCVKGFADHEGYRNDARFLKIWILYADAIQDFERVFKMMEQKGICQAKSLLYEAYAIFLVAKGKLLEANRIIQLGISRNAEPLDRLNQMKSLFLDHVAALARDASSYCQADMQSSLTPKSSHMDPWSLDTQNGLLQKMAIHIRKYKGFNRSNKRYSGKVSLTTLHNSSRNKIVELGGIKYQIKGCSGVGGFAQVYKASVDSNPDEVVALKIQNPAFPWEFYMYRQLDLRISDNERPCFGFAHKVHVFANLSVLVCDYLSHGTLQDAINSYLVMQKLMEEELCIYYTNEMLRMLEDLHSVDIIHGDFKPDNLLVRYARERLTGDTFGNRNGPWRNQGLCLVDWGRGIDLRLFPAGTEFQADCRTSGFRCIQMQENRPWAYQVDTYGLCAIVHMMLHGTYMNVEKIVKQDGSFHYQPKSAFKRYWNVELWRMLFSTLLNRTSNENDVPLLRSLRKSFEDYMHSNPQLIIKLERLLVKQKVTLCA